MNQHASWNIDRDQARLETSTSCGGHSFEIDLRFPQHGLQNIRFGKFSVKGLRPLGVTPSPPAPKDGETLIDHFVRADDLVVTYAQTPTRTIRPQWDWRIADASPKSLGVDLVLAVQTALLDSDPTLTVCTELTRGTVSVPDPELSGKWIEVGESQEMGGDRPGLFLFRAEEIPVSYAEMVFPADFRGARLTVVGPSIGLTYQLTPEFLEKGVIRKARIQGWLLSQEGDHERAMQAYHSLLAAAPPLTT